MHIVGTHLLFALFCNDFCHVFVSMPTEHSHVRPGWLRQICEIGSQKIRCATCLLQAHISIWCGQAHNKPIPYHQNGDLGDCLWNGVYHGLSWFIMVYHGLSWFIMVYHGLSWFITYEIIWSTLIYCGYPCIPSHETVEARSSVPSQAWLSDELRGQKVEDFIKKHMWSMEVSWNMGYKNY